MKKSIDQIIKEYKQLRKQYPDQWIKLCKKQNSITKVLEIASKAKENNDKKHPHQYRVPNETLDSFYKLVCTNLKLISGIKRFDDLYDIINNCRIPGVGALTVYDTANRIGSFLRIYPDKVYIHQGTKVGAEKLLRKKIHDKTLHKGDFKQFNAYKNLTCAEIEDILCIYKDDLFKSKCARIERIKVTCG
jgi:hypothetical protein